MEQEIKREELVINKWNSYSPVKRKRVAWSIAQDEAVTDWYTWLQQVQL